jgi:hypothetical protein
MGQKNKYGPGARIAAIWVNGTYDFQRDNGIFYSAYTGNAGAPAQSLALIDIGTLVAQQKFGDFTICIYRSNVFGDNFQLLSDNDTCEQTAPRPQ